MRTVEIMDDSLTILTRRHSGLILPLSAAAKEIGIHLRTAHNQISKGVFPIPTILRDRRRYVHISELASYLEQLRQRAAEDHPSSKSVTRKNEQQKNAGGLSNDA